jgi:hypothetical protein
VLASDEVATAPPKALAVQVLALLAVNGTEALAAAPAADDVSASPFE